MSPLLGRFKFLSSNSPPPDYQALSAVYEPSTGKAKNPAGKTTTKGTSLGNSDEIVEMIVEPRAGRVAIFTAGPENTHRVEKVCLL